MVTIHKAPIANTRTDSKYTDIIKRHSKELILKAKAFMEKGNTFKNLKEVFNLTSPTYYNCIKKLEAGLYDKKIVQVRKGKIDKQALQTTVLENPELTLNELAAQFNCTRGAMHNAKKIRLCFKKADVRVKKTKFQKIKLNQAKKRGKRKQRKNCN